MREIYACQLNLEEVDSDARGMDHIKQIIRDWLARGSGISDVDLVGGRHSTGSGSIVEVESVEDGDAGGADGWTCDWRRPDDKDSTLIWRTLIALSRPDADSARFTVRLGLERAGEDFLFRRLKYEFRAPTIVRTLLREYRCVDAGQVLRPDPTEMLANEISDLARLLEDPSRRLPVIVITSYPVTGKPLVDTGDLARQLAGIAHVIVLQTHLAAMALADCLGRDMSVWQGGARLYWPGFTLNADPRFYRYWPARVLQERPNTLVVQLRQWLGAQAALSVPENPAVARARKTRQRLLEDRDAVPAWVTDYMEEVDAEISQLKTDNELLQRELADAQQAAEKATDDLSAMRMQFRELAGYYGKASDPEVDEAIDWGATTVLGAYEMARTDSGPHVTYLPNADDAVRRFTSYRNPRRLYEALMTVNHAAEAWQSNSLGAGFGEYFAERGYEYSQRNPAAQARATKSSYRVSYEGRTVVLEPHLKVDQASNPDQCLRIYWYVDEENRLLVIGHVGRHLPD